MPVTKRAALWGNVLGLAALGASAAIYTGFDASPTGTGSAEPLPVLNLGQAGKGNPPNPGHPITLSGTVVGQLRPGSPTTLDVTITNDNNQAIVVTSVTGAITSVSTGALPGLPSCSTSWYSIGSFSGSRTIDKRASAVVAIPLSLDDLATINQDNCKGATVQLRFTAQARQQ